MSPIPVSQMITIIGILVQLVQEALASREETVHLETLGQEHREVLERLRDALEHGEQ